MKFYRLTHSLDEKEIGTYPQVSNGVIPTTWDDSNYISNFLLKKAPNNVYVPKGILNSKANPTDLISSSFVGFSLNLFTSQKLKEIICDSNYYGIQFFKSSVFLKGDIELEYWILHPYEFGYEALDFDHSTFGILENDISTNIKEEVKLSSPVELRKMENKISEIKKINSLYSETLFIQQIVFKDDIDLDFFSLKNINGGVGYFLSEKLKFRILDSNLSGMEFT